MSAEKNGAREQAGRRGDQGMKTPGRILAFPPRRRFCSGCGIEFLPARAAHALCGKCFAWSRIAALVRATRAALAEVAR